MHAGNFHGFNCSCITYNILHHLKLAFILFNNQCPECGQYHLKNQALKYSSTVDQKSKEDINMVNISLYKIRCMSILVLVGTYITSF